ncbi:MULTISPECIES: gluconolaconase [unclassified Streptomyces]|uniref:gluconolaconase n=1 Tax=unclassified Streptomyces TaxID=2593676 RepID=UPI001BEA7C67|nr:MULTISPECIES: gluconolaconase [unclassified Streptomyces]MBT2407531.1 gluconolaconase [Streptomyces sp. ISL-21]MBT2459916.1 gluconolaconase [Streptomyces sp. ISL-86]MBT2608130.1 gluconolaconase [Streptomyces sp. ISL-87]
MGQGSARNDVGTAYINDVFMRHPLTTRNQEELGIAARAAGILERNLNRGVFRRNRQGGGEQVNPIGFSLNMVSYPGFPDDEQTAHARGWRAWMNVGVPVIEERSDIQQPPPDMISKQTYINGTDPIKITVTDTVEFSISNTISWSLQGEVKLTFGAKSTAALQQQLQKSMDMKQYQKTTLLNSKDNQGVNTESQTEATSNTTATSSVTGTGELWGELALGITGSVSGSLTTEWKHVSSVSLEVSSRVDVLATTRRQIRQFDYEFPVTFGGWVALYYPDPVEVKETAKQGAEPRYSKVIAWKLGEAALDSSHFDVADEGKRFMQKGTAETVAVRAGEHRVFQPEVLDYQTQKQPL